MTEEVKSALSMIDQVCAGVSMRRGEHETLRKAINTIIEALEQKKEEKNK